MKLSEVLKSQMDSIQESLERSDEILNRTHSNLQIKTIEDEKEKQWLEDWSRIVD
jgi:cellobiose-specific phosphotransferase system component IIA